MLIFTLEKRETIAWNWQMQRFLYSVSHTRNQLFLKVWNNLCYAQDFFHHSFYARSSNFILLSLFLALFLHFFKTVKLAFSYKRRDWIVKPKNVPIDLVENIHKIIYFLFMTFFSRGYKLKENILKSRNKSDQNTKPGKIIWAIVKTRVMNQIVDVRFFM